MPDTGAQAEMTANNRQRYDRLPRYAAAGLARLTPNTRQAGQTSRSGTSTESIAPHLVRLRE